MHLTAIRRVATGIVALTGLVPALLHAQASAYVPLDDPRLPALEHLITRGDIEDPSPMVRPFRRRAIAASLAAADSAPDAPTGALIHTLRLAFTDDTAAARWNVDIRAGGQAYTQKRRDQLHLGGVGGANPYADFGLQAFFGPLALVSRPAVEPRLINDPDWPNGAQQNVTARLIDGYASLQSKFATLEYGQVDRNWGPVGLPGIPVSNIGYERQGVFVEAGGRTLHLSALMSDLDPDSTATGGRINRYFFAHRVDVQFSRTFRLALWETAIVQGVGSNYAIYFRNPLTAAVATNTFGLRDASSNIIVGADLQRRFGRHTLQAQLALDDFWFNKRNENRDRYLFTIAGFGPLGRTLSWRALYSQASALALRTFNPAERFANGTVGIGRDFTDNAQLTLQVTAPVGRRLLVSGDLTRLLQGEGNLNLPYPTAQPDGTLIYPTFLVGTVEKTHRAGLGVSGRLGIVDLQASGGINRVTNADHVAGRTATRATGAIQVTLRWHRDGRFRDAL